MAGTASGVGKTTVATGLMAALSRRGLQVAGAKVGPDFIDPGYHSAACGRPGRNLDPWMCGPEAVGSLAARAALGADVLVVEGVMGLFDGAGMDRDGREPPPGRGVASTAEVAALIGAPVVLVVDAAALSGSVAALVHGFRTFDASIRVAGVVLNRVASDGHELMLRRALQPLDVNVLGALRRDERIRWRDRHLGLVPVVEQPAAVRSSLGRLATAIERSCDVDGLLALAASAGARCFPPLPATRHEGVARIAVAAGRAFSFAYRDNLERLEEAGAELVEVDATEDRHLPEAACALYAGGGFPEVYADALSENRPLLADVALRARRGMPVWAECGGLLWLCESLDGKPLCGVIPAGATSTDRLKLGYRRAKVTTASVVARPGEILLGHEFHYTRVEPAGDALRLSGREGTSAGGFASGSLMASYLHMHLGAEPAPAERFVAAAVSHRGSGKAGGGGLASTPAGPSEKPVRDRRVQSSL